MDLGGWSRVTQSLASLIYFWISSSEVQRLGDLLFSRLPSGYTRLFWRDATWAKSSWLSSLKLYFSWRMFLLSRVIHSRSWS